MPEEPLDPYIALDAIRTFARVAMKNEDPTIRAYELTMREILNACDRAMPPKPRGSRKPKPT